MPLLYPHIPPLPTNRWLHPATNSCAAQIFLSALWPLIASTALDAGNNGGTVMSLILFFGYFGAAVIPYVIGLVGDAAGLRVALVASAFVFAALGAVVRFMMPRHISEKRTEA